MLLSHRQPLTPLYHPLINKPLHQRLRRMRCRRIQSRQGQRKQKNKLGQSPQVAQQWKSHFPLLLRGHPQGMMPLKENRWKGLKWDNLAAPLHHRQQRL
eukprot:10964146-Karenia_brevis.AAC.1